MALSPDLVEASYTNLRGVKAVLRCRCRVAGHLARALHLRTLAVRALLAGSVPGAVPVTRTQVALSTATAAIVSAALSWDGIQVAVAVCASASAALVINHFSR